MTLVMFECVQKQFYIQTNFFFLFSYIYFKIY